MATMPIYGKNHLETFFSRTKKLETVKLDIKHGELEASKVCSSDDPRLTFLHKGQIDFPLRKK